MDTIYYITGTIMTFTFIGLIIAAVLFFVKPHLLNKHKRIKKPVSRRKIVLISLLALFLTQVSFGGVLAATEPANVKAARIAATAAQLKAEQAKEQEARARAEAEAQRKHEEEAKRPNVIAESKTEAIPFESTEQEDNTLAKGEVRVATEGTDGERTITFEVTYIQGKEIARKEIKNEITKASITKVTRIGTYVAPTYTPSIYQQSNVRVGAVCEDGWQSSATGSGACSHHGGVAYWLYE